MELHNGEFKIVKADETDLDVREQMGQIFADGFSQWLNFFSKDKQVIAKAFQHMFVLDKFYVAVIDGEVAGVTACTKRNYSSVKLNKKELIKHLGLYKGALAGLLLKKPFEKYHENLLENTGAIEFVGTARNFQGRGVASLLIQHIIENTPYDNFIIDDVADTNIPAIKLYEKLGFEEYDRTEMPGASAKNNGMNYLVSFKYMN